MGEPLVYAYYPAHGWAWVVAPWLWGVGPWPYFGPRGPGLFTWYRWGYWRTPARWRFRPAPLRRDFAGHPLGIRPAPPRVVHREREREHGHRERR